MPHGHCYFWAKNLIALHAISDSLITLAYYSIPITLIYFVRKRSGIEFNWMFVCFAVFIMACGTTHLLEVWNIWHADYWLSGSVKAVTALTSLGTALLLVKLAPQAAALPCASDWKRLNDALQSEIAEHKKSERKFRDLLESAPDAMVIVDDKGKIVLINSQTERLFGYSREELLGCNVEALIPHRFRENHTGLRNHFTAHSKTRGMDSNSDLCALRKNGTEFSVEISLSPLETEEGKLTSASIRDVTARKQIEQALSEKNLELEDANLAKDRFLAAMSHELRTPLNAIIGFTGTLLMKLAGPLTPEQEKQLRIIQTSGRHLVSLINELLDLAKVESGKYQLTIEPVICQEVVNEVASSLRALAQNKAIAFEVKLPPGEAIVRTDRRALSQILLNLCGNAIKFTEKGSVSVSCKQRGAKGARLTEFSVQDTGIGIPETEQAKLFQAFEQATASPTTAHEEGSGLGLHLSQKLAALLNGQITFISAPGQGSTFTLTLVEK